MKYLTLMILLVLGVQLVSAQTGTRRLPPSLERELKLRKGSGVRIMTFSDTLKAKTRIAESIRNTSLQELDSTMVQDSAIVVLDSAVSGSHKEWLDEHILELPEYRMTSSGPRFFYPLSNLIDTRRRVIPFDSTLPQKMETVERERLTANEALPLTRPIAHETPTWLLFNAGVGTIAMPMLNFIAFPTKDITAEVALQNNLGSNNALRSLFKAKGNIELFFPVADQRPDVLIPQLNFGLEHNNRKRLVRNVIDTGDYSFANTQLVTTFQVGELDKLRLKTSGAIRFLSDEVIRTISETSTSLDLGLAHEERPYLFGFDLRYHSAGDIDIAPETSTYLASIGATFGLITEEKFKIGGGLAFASGKDASGSRSGVLPHAFLKWQQNPFLLLSASVARSYYLATMQNLANTNMFYSPVAADTSFHVGDPRRVVLEPLRITAGIEYTVSLVERLGVEVRYIMSESEPVFELLTDSITGRSAFVATPKDARKFEAEAKVTLLLFKGDELNASVLFTSSTIATEERSMPFAPTMHAAVTYRMKALAPTLTPVVEFIHLARPDKSISLINGEASFGINDNLSLFGRIENIFNAAGDFWTAHNEHPRNILVGVRGRF
jgi:hypothetical protein